MKVKKRLCCLVLVVCLTISLFPVNAFATSGISSQYSDEEIEEIMSQCPYTVTGGSYGESYVYDVTSQKLTLYSGTLSVSGTPNKSDPAYIEVAPNSVLELTIRDVSPVSDVNGANGGPGLKIGANATVNLVLAGENMFCRGWDDIHDYSVYLDNNAKVTVSGNGSLICNKNYGYPKLYLSDTAELRQHRTIAEASAVESPIRRETIGFPAHFFARAHNFKPPGRACQPEADSPMRT